MMSAPSNEKKTLRGSRKKSLRFRMEIARTFLMPPPLRCDR